MLSTRITRYLIGAAIVLSLAAYSPAAFAKDAAGSGKADKTTTQAAKSGAQSDQSGTKANNTGTKANNIETSNNAGSSMESGPTNKGAKATAGTHEAGVDEAGAASSSGPTTTNVKANTSNVKANTSENQHANRANDSASSAGTTNAGQTGGATVPPPGNGFGRWIFGHGGRPAGTD